ncbi:MAG TPA: biotin synthase BioB [Candidatus Omnitrophica bacterium]|nr:biotin synthase BioB [Candidatus Omnitrophota bacterium]
MEHEEIDSLLRLPLIELIAAANSVRREHAGPGLELCNIMNAKSGSCSQDCKFCAQSAHHATGVSTYPLKKKDEMLEAARRAKEAGAHRFDIVTSGNTLTKDEIKVIADAVSDITRNIGIKMCASLGKIQEADLLLLKDSGLTRYHHNIETSRNFFHKIVSSHTFEDRLTTIRAAKATGLEVCSGGIIGLGETMADRIDMALCLRELGVDSVPINILVPIKGTLMEGQAALSCEEAVRTIAIFRIILKDKIIKIAAGRESVLKDFQALAFMAGANGMLIGGYLTIKGRMPEEDLKLVSEVKKLWQN